MNDRGYVTKHVVISTLQHARLLRISDRFQNSGMGDNYSAALRVPLNRGLDDIEAEMDLSPMTEVEAVQYLSDIDQPQGGAS